jgi:lipopolysaccharide biosynthesis regulator YciM
MWEILFLLLPLATLSGWYLGRRIHVSQTLKKLIGLNYLLQQEPNKAVDVFVKLLETDQETVDTHLALGGLFRRQGEVDKAISIHQNLISKPSLTEKQRAQSLLELSRDYMRAGVLDRAENCLLDLVNQGQELEASLYHLIDIYQQSKDWERAIQSAHKLESTTKRNMSHHIAHFNCELAEQHWLKGEQEVALTYLKTAYEINKKCVRTSLLLGNMEAQAGRFDKAIKAYKKVEKQDFAFLSEIIFPLARCYEHLNDPEGMVRYFEERMSKDPNHAVVLAYTDWLSKNKGESSAAEFILRHLRQYPSLLGLNRLIHYNIANSEGHTKDELKLIQELIEKMLTNKPSYRCQACGFSGRTLQWQCPSCKRWDVIKPLQQ